MPRLQMKKIPGIDLVAGGGKAYLTRHRGLRDEKGQALVRRDVRLTLGCRRAAFTLLGGS